MLATLINIVDDVIRPTWPICVWDRKTVKAKNGQIIVEARGGCQLDCWSCGLVAAYTAYKALLPHSHVTIRQFRQICKPSVQCGIERGPIKAALRACGLKCSEHWFIRFKTVIKAVESGRVIIVGTGGDYFTSGDHWMLIHGVDVNRNKVLISNHTQLFNSTQWVKWKKFRSEWNPPLWGIVVGKND